MTFSSYICFELFGGLTSVLATPLWGMLYADDARVVSQSPEQLRKMMGVIVVVCAAFGLTVSEANTEIMGLRTKGTPESTATFSVQRARCTTKRTSLYTSGETSTITVQAYRVRRSTSRYGLSHWDQSRRDMWRGVITPHY